MTYADLIKQWFDRSISEEDIFTKYIFLYISFIAFLTQANSGDNDRERINYLKGEERARDYYLDLVDKDFVLKDNFNLLIKELKNQPIRNLTRSNDSTNWEGKEGVIKDLYNWSNLVEFWYRVRNNLFHGHKAPDFDRDRRLVNFAFITLLPLMQNFISHDLFWEFD